MSPLAVTSCVLVALCLLGVVWLMAVAERAPMDPNDDEADNARARLVHAQAGNKWYPHILEDGSIRWYRIKDDDPA